MNWVELADRVLGGQSITREEALAVVEASDTEVLGILDAAYRVRSHHHGKSVKVHVLQNAKSGACPEDCRFCSQSISYDTSVDRYGMQSVETLVEKARSAVSMGAVTYCMVTSTRGPSKSEVDKVCEAARRIKSDYPALRLCASLGMIDSGQAALLAEAGIDRYNHNLETSKKHFAEVVTTHTFDDRVATVRAAKSAGMEACCGGILGMGESAVDWVDLAFTLRELGVESVPVNFLDPRPATPMEAAKKLTPMSCLKALAMFRFVLPAADLRVAGGREVILGTLQPLSLFAANSFFTNGYLTTPGAPPSADWRMIEEAGFEAEVLST